MIIEVNIPDGSDELAELQEVVAKANKENPLNLITEAQYVHNIVLGYFTNRVKNEYIGYVKSQDIITLKNKFGSLSNIRGKR